MLNEYIIMIFILREFGSGYVEASERHSDLISYRIRHLVLLPVKIELFSFFAIADVQELIGLQVYKQKIFFDLMFYCKLLTAFSEFKLIFHNLNNSFVAS